MKIEDVLGGITVGAALTCVGFIFLFRKEKVIEAFLASNKVFWGEMNYRPNEDRNRAIANIMIPFMGVVFLAGGIASIVKVVLSLFGA
jgi:hypothetical protein